MKRGETGKRVTNEQRPALLAALAAAGLAHLLGCPFKPSLVHALKRTIETGVWQPLEDEEKPR